MGFFGVSRERANLELLGAAQHGSDHFVREALAYGADVNFRDKDGMTPLMWAADRTWLTVMDTLINHGADINIADKNGWTALHWAAADAGAQSVELLLNRGAAKEKRTLKAQLTPLMLAVRSETIETMVKLGCDPAARDKHGRTAAERLRTRFQKCLTALGSRDIRNDGRQR